MHGKNACPDYTVMSQITSTMGHGQPGLGAQTGIPHKKHKNSMNAGNTIFYFYFFPTFLKITFFYFKTTFIRISHFIITHNRKKTPSHVLCLGGAGGLFYCTIMSSCWGFPPQVEFLEMFAPKDYKEAGNSFGNISFFHNLKQKTLHICYT
jgi:hypothetical protein